MRKFVIFTVLVVMALTLMGGFALAGGWTTVDYNKSHDPNGLNTTDPVTGISIAIWNPTEAVNGVFPNNTRSPHGNFSSTSNRCRVCHAVHGANSDSWRLLGDGATDLLSACDVCHDTGGLTNAQPYGVKVYTTIRGEHTLGSTVVPDSSVSLGNNTAAALSCNSCHSVHGANTLQGANVRAGDEYLGKILRLDPNGDESRLASGTVGIEGSGTVVVAGGADSSDAAATNFCSDCHNKNPNWNDVAPLSQDVTRTNGASHVQGPAADGTLSVNGITTTVAWDYAKAGCRDCHSASDAGNYRDTTYTASGLNAFPHQTASDKLLMDEIQEGGSATATNDAERIVPNMDTACARCHTNSISDGNFDTATAGVGKSF
jgi:hypothetical protein